MRGFVPTPPKVVDFMVSRLFRGRPPKSSDTVLDPGCGTGTFIAGILRWCNSAGADVPRIIGIELEPGRAKQARDTFRSYPQVEIRQGDFLGPSRNASYDFVIANPPYVSILGLSESEKRDFRMNYVTARGRFDLYLLFFERALESLEQNGRLVFITPEKFLYVDTAAPLRRLLSRFRVEEIRLEDEQVFDSLVTYPTITTVANRTPQKPTLIRLRDGLEHEYVLTDGGESWMPLIRGASVKVLGDSVLQNICVRVSCGVATGADEVFVRETKLLERELAAFARPTIAGRELACPGKTPQPRYSLLLPYTKTGSLIEQGNLGALGVYLRRPWNRERLLQRTCVKRKPWYSFHETPPLREMLRPKILCKDITQHPCFWIDRSGDLVPRHSVYYIVPTDVGLIDQLCTHLNSKKVSDWLSEHCQRAANGYLRLQSSVLKSIPIFDGLQPARARKHVTKSLNSSRKQSGFAFLQAPR